jgi:cellulose synthase/poly-beta-1,6-N-acetylglucosamine synthase-like glycosyltransferase
MTVSTVILNTYLFALVVVAFFSFETIYLALVYMRSKRKNIVNIEKNGYEPRVTVQLPVYNELYVAKRLINAVCALTYPKNKLEIQVLDDSTDETQDICRAEVARFKQMGYDIIHLHRAERTGFKAGALQAGLEVAKGELIAIFDADFIPSPDFIKKTAPYFSDPKLGMVQTRWDHLNEEYSLITRAQAFGLAGHFVVEQNGRNAAGYFINFNGTAGIWRKKCIEDAGSWQADTLTEDLDLSYRAQLKGWKFLFLHDIVTPSELPAEINALKSQQYRWTKGAVETAMKILPKLWKSKLPVNMKIHSTLHLTNNFVYPFILLLALLNLPLLIIKKEIPESGYYFFIFAFFLLSFWASFLFYAISHKSLYRDWKKRMALFPLFLSGSMGFAVNNTRAVIEGLLRIKTPFIRTPKYRMIGKTGEFVSRYRMALSKGVIFEILMAIYCCVGVVVSFYYFELGIMPFMLMFFLGFGLIGYLSIKHYLKHKM